MFNIFRCVSEQMCRGVQMFTDNNCSLLYDGKSYFKLPQDQAIERVSLTNDETYEVTLKGRWRFNDFDLKNSRLSGKETPSGVTAEIMYNSVLWAFGLHSKVKVPQRELPMLPC